MHEVHGETVKAAQEATNLTTKATELEEVKDFQDLGKLEINGVEYLFQKSGDIFSFSSVANRQNVTNVVNHIFEEKSQLEEFIAKLQEGLK